MPVEPTPPAPHSARPFCPNCFHPEPGEYCPHCGQKQVERRASVRQLVEEFLDEQFGINRRLPRTLKPLLFKPGFLTREYFEGRVQQYIPPLRLYLVTSVLFFALFILGESSGIEIERAGEEARAELRADTALQRNVRSSRGPVIGIRLDASDTANYLANPDVGLGNERLNAAVEAKLQEYAVYGEVEGTRRLIREVLSAMPTVVFFLLPVFAFLLWLFFRRQRRYYVEHFVFALHLHAFAFLAMLPMPLLDLPFLPKWASDFGEALSGFLMLWVFAYVFFAMRRVYGQRKLMIALKYFFLWILYFTVLGIGIVFGGVAALMT